MAAGSRDRPPMLATGRYAQWRSRFLRYIDTRPNGDALRKCILTGPYTPTMVTTPAVPATENSPEILQKHHSRNVEASRGLQNKVKHSIFKMSDKLIWELATRYKGKEIAKPITPPSESASEEDSDPEQAQKDKDMQKNLALIAKYFKKLYKPTNNNLRTSSNTRNKNVDTNSKLRKGVQLQAEQSDWLADTMIENDNNKIEAHYSYMAKIQEVPNADSGTDLETSDDNKKIQKQLKKANATLTQELTECKSILAETSRTLGESNSIRDSCLVALQNKQTEFERYKAFNDRTVDICPT
ncbi:hypothetical protein Tco_1172636 [Tanacetum coccineum]